MKYLGLAAAALVMTMGASAATITATCGSFAISGGGGTGSWVCPTFSSLTNGGTVTSAFVVYESDYSTGVGASNATQTVFTFTGTGAAFATDTVTSTGGSNSSTPTSLDGLPFNVLNPGPPTVLAGFYNVLTIPVGSALTVGYTNSVTAGSVLATTGYAQLDITYTPSAVPEPGSMILLGGGLVAASLIGRKKFARK